MVQKSGHLAERLYRVLIPETKRAVASIDNWAALATLAGMVRPENQDRLLGGEFTSIDGRRFHMIALSDGMGGLRNGQQAAALTLASFLWFLTSSNGNMADRLVNAADHANLVVADRYSKQAGATLSALVIMKDGDTLMLNVGDSRVYGYDEDGGLVQLSDDDTLAGLAGRGLEIDARHNGNALLQHIGMGEGLEPHVSIVDEASSYRFFMLTTDGIHWVGNKLLSLIAENASDHVQLARRLLSLSEMTGAHDNASIATMSANTAVMLDFQQSGDMIDMELWTPNARTILMSERANFNSQTEPTSPDKPPPKVPLADGRKDDPKQANNRSVTVRKKRPGRRKQKPSPQEELPIGKPEIFIDIESRGLSDD